MSLKDIRIGFDLDDPMQNEAYAFLKKIDHKRGAFISFLVTEFLLNNYKGDASKMTKEEAKIFATYILGEYANGNDESSHSASNKINAMLNVLSRTPSAGLVNLSKSKNPTSTVMVQNLHNDNELPTPVPISNSSTEDCESDDNKLRTVLNTESTVQTVSDSVKHNMSFEDVAKEYNSPTVDSNIIHQNGMETEDDFEDFEDFENIEDDSQINEAAFNAMMGMF